MRFFTMVELAAIASSLICLAAAMMFGVDSAPLNCGSEKFLNRKVGKGKPSVSFPLMHIYSECSPFRPPNRTWESLVSETFRGDANRLLFLKRSMATSRSSKVDQEEDTDVGVMAAQRIGEYLIKVDFGTSKQSMYTIIDTGSDVAWIPCKQCQNCDSSAAPPFDPTMSSSYKSLACDSQSCQQANQSSLTYCDENSECRFEIRYGLDGSAGQVDGLLSSDAISLGSQNLPDFSFGCADAVKNETIHQPGLIGLGGGALSLLNQPTAELFGGTFSYCLPSLASSASSASGSLVLGKEALSTSSLQFTTLVKNHSSATYYYVNLMGISVGETAISVLATSIASGGGTIIDSGTTLTHLVAPAYTALRDAFRAQIPNRQATQYKTLDTCYDTSSSSVDVPSITLHLDGSVDLVLPKENILYSPGNELMCLAFVSSDSLTIIGNVNQQNWRIVFDVPNSQVGFAKEQCSAA